MELQRNTLHLSRDENPDFSEYMATKSAGDPVELTVNGTIREIQEGGVVIDIISASASDYAPPLSAEDEQTSAAISSALGSDF